MNRSLASIAEVFTGLTLRGVDSAKSSPEGDYCLLRIGDLREDGHIQISSPTRIKVDPQAAERYRLSPGDVVVASRGSRATAAVFDSDLPTVAGSQFFIVRPRREVVLAGYLQWYLNLPDIQTDLLSAARGSYVRSISVAVIKNLLIPVPPLEVQRRILKILDLQAQERRLLAQITEKRCFLVRQELLAAASNPYVIT